MTSFSRPILWMALTDNWVWAGCINVAVEIGRVNEADAALDDLLGQR